MAHLAQQDLVLVNAFTNTDGEGGNPAAVVLDADDLSDGDKLAIAAAAGLSETAFVSRSSIASIKLEFFTPRRRIAHCGHATIATFGYLGSIGVLASGLHSKETVDGTRDVAVEGTYASMEQRPPHYSDVDRPSVLKALHLDASQIDSRFPPQRVDTGNGFVLVGVKTAAVLAGLSVDAYAVERLSDIYDLIGFYVFTTNVSDETIAASARMFAPRYGIAEEAATGMAAGPLACLLYREGAGGVRMSIEQGRFMVPASPSRLDAVLTVRNGEISKLSIGGQARMTGSTTVSYARPT